MIHSNRVAHAGILISFVVLLAATGVVAFGARERDKSPRYNEYMQEQIQRHATTADGKEALNRAGRAALVLSQTAAFDTCCSGFLLLAFVFGVLATRSVAHASSRVRFGVSAIVVLGCFFGVAGLVGDAIENYHWGFNTLALGHVLTAVGLGLGGLGVVATTTQSRGATNVE